MGGESTSQRESLCSCRPRRSCKVREPTRTGLRKEGPMDEHRGVVKVVLGILLFALTSVTYADDNDVPKEFDVCVDPTQDVVPDLVGAPHTFPAPGDGFVAVGIIVPVGVIPTTKTGDTPPACSTFTNRIGTFFARGRIVAGLPNAEADDLAYVSWHFRLAGGSLETGGPVKAAPRYPQLVLGKSGHVDAGREVTVVVLDPTGFQFRLFLK